MAAKVMGWEDEVYNDGDIGDAKLGFEEIWEE